MADCLAALLADRRATLSAVRKAINENLPDGYEKRIQFGMIGSFCKRSIALTQEVTPAYAPTAEPTL